MRSAPGLEPARTSPTPRSASSSTAPPLADVPDPIAPSTAAVLALFEHELDAVRFPDLDRATLEQLASEARSAAIDVARARAMLDAAKAELTERQERLDRAAQRALAYARVFAEGDEALSAKVDELSASSPTKSRARERSSAGEASPIKRPRKKAKAEESADLPFEGAA